MELEAELEALSITVGFSTTNKLISRIIRWITRAPCSHAWVAFNDHTLGIRLVLQAESWGYEARPWERWQRENILVDEFEVRDHDLAEDLRFIAKSLGLKYDWRSALFAGIRRWFKTWIKGRFQSPKRLMCSEAVIRMLQHAEVQAVAHLDPESTSPGRLLELARWSYSFQRVDDSGAS